MTVILAVYFFKLYGVPLCKGGGPRNRWTVDSCLNFNLFGEHALEVAIPALAPLQGTRDGLCVTPPFFVTPRDHILCDSFEAQCVEYIPSSHVE